MSKATSAGGTRRRISAVLLSTTAVVSLALPGIGVAQERTINSDAVLESDSSYAGIRIISGATVVGENIVLTQSSNAYGAQVVDGSLTLNGGSITQAGAGKYVTGVGVVSGTADVTNMTININGAKDASALYSNGAAGIISASGLDVYLNAVGSTTAEPASAVKVRAGTVATEGSTFRIDGDTVFGLLASGNNGNQAFVESRNDTITTSGSRGYGAFAFSDDRGTSSGTITLDGSSISTAGERGFALAAQGRGAIINANGTLLVTSGDNAHAANASGSQINLTNATIVTNGFHSYGVSATAGSLGQPSSITLNGGSILTANETGRGTQNGDGSRAYALYASGAGAQVSASQTSIQTLGQRAYGAYAINGSSIDLSNLSISTDGFMAYGVYASSPNSVLTANNVNIVTNGQAGDAAWAYNGGVLNLNGGLYLVQGGQNPNSPGETANGLVAVGGVDGQNNGVINANGINVVTQGANSSGIKVGALIGTSRTSGIVNLQNSNITVNGQGAYAASLAYGGSLTSSNSNFTSLQGAGFLLSDSASLTLTGTSVASLQETFVSQLSSSGQSQTISVGAGTVATRNNGTLLAVERSQDGADGVVNLVLGAGSNTSGNIVDLDTKTSGRTNVTLAAGALWKGQMLGVSGFQGQPGGSAEFQGPVAIEGDLAGNGTSFIFSPEGGSITGNVGLSQGSRTTGGSIETPITVGGNFSVDETSVMGGNWAITGDLANAGTLTPGNSIGRVSVGGNLSLAPASVYEVDVDAAGNADRVDVAGTANLAGSVTVTPLGGFVLNQPYTILTAGTLGGSTFDSVSMADDYAFIAPTLSYVDASVLLTIARNTVSYASLATTANQTSVANALETLPLSSELGSVIAYSTAPAARGAFDQLSGEVHSSLKTGLSEESGHVRDIAMDRIRAAFDSTSAAGSTSGPWEGGQPANSPEPAAWARVYGSWGHTSGNGNAGRLDRDTGGFIAGVDGFVQDTVHLGMLAGYSRSSFDVESRASSADIDTYHLGIYAGTQVHGFGLRGGLAYSWHDIETSRSVAFPGFVDALSGDYNAGTAQVFAELGYAIDMPGARIEPFAGIAYVNVDVDGFTETGGAAALSTASSNFETVYTTLGIRGETEFALNEVALRATGMVGWRHAFNDTVPASTFLFDSGSPFETAGVPIARNAAVLEVGLETDLTPDASLGISYNGQFGDGAQEHGARATFAYRF
ncbi:autotransporter domain-containing protein [Aureimonas fodinaquatilis]|uniref:Autotransporter domain-containing protein n=1 Tax=Aureimonas fodinaquatilis TaxID=2565783 RepID=A0A5B0DRQ6_9HYPH|nr:autotransporter domain-containing protein [Aureimonas fodinaquatilis]KAA0969053.1 autotransporter domain-containing protein [Aureimonas fodinaquatilis]